MTKILCAFEATLPTATKDKDSKNSNRTTVMFPVETFYEPNSHNNSNQCTSATHNNSNQYTSTNELQTALATNTDTTATPTSTPTATPTPAPAPTPPELLNNQRNQVNGILGINSQTRASATATATPVLRISQTHSINNDTAKGKKFVVTPVMQITQNEKRPQSPTLPTASPPSSPSSDIIANVLGDFGIWQLRSTLILYLCKIPSSWFMACIIFTAPEIEPHTNYHCDTREFGGNGTVTQDQCYLLDWSGNEPEDVMPNGSIETVQSIEPCADFIYQDDFYSLIMQFNLICLRSIFVAWTQYWHLFGVLAGGVLGTKAMLIISPRTIFIIGAVLQIGMGVITGYAPDLLLHCIFRCLSAICCALMFTSAQAIFVDITSGRYRTGVVILFDSFWSIGIILLPGISSFFKSWNHIYLGITFPTIIILTLIQWIPESPRWLLKNGNEQDVYRVERMLRQAVGLNERNFHIPADFRQQLEKLRNNMHSQKPPATWLQLWRGPRALRYMMAAHIALACFIVGYMGMLLNIRSFGREYRVPNTIAMGFVELIGYFIAIRLVMKCNEKKFIYVGVFNIITALIGCLGWTFTGIGLNPNLKVTLWVLIAVFPKISVACAYSLLMACMAEVMPAQKRQPFVFSVVTWARIWLLSAPFINVLKQVDVALSLTTFSLITLLGGICTCFLHTPTEQQVHENKINNTQSNLSIVAYGNDGFDGSESEAIEKACSPLNNTVWTVESELDSTRL